MIKAEGCENVQYHTQQLGQDVHAGQKTNMCFSIVTTVKTEVEFLAHWGTSSYYPSFIQGNSSSMYIIHGSSIHLVAPDQEDAPLEVRENVHIVQDGETLGEIADRYNVTLEQLLTYNGLTETSVVDAGNLILIPPLDEIKPEENESGTEKS